MGEVTALGPGGRGTERDGEELLIMKESDIMGVLDVPATKKKAA